MENPGPFLLEVIYDEQTGFGDTGRGDGGGFGDREDHTWLSELLEEVDKSKDDDSDDVVVVDEVFPPAPKKLKLQTLNASLEDVDTEGGGGFGDARSGGCGFGDREDHFWLSDLVVEVDRSKDDDSDEVVVVSEVFLPPPKKLMLPTLKPALNRKDSADDDDDDCVVLEDDPDKAAVVVNSNVDYQDDDSDDVEIVGEKGEVACRDFPHARHLCARFLFSSTPHETHCSQCHCYVCDSLAPCPDWGTGISSIDHCHATDKEEYWRTERKRQKEGCRLLPVAPTNINTPFFAGIPETNHRPTVPPLSGSLLHNPGFGPTTVHPDSLSSNASVPNATDPGRVYRHGFLARYGPQFQSHRTFNRNLSSGYNKHDAGNRNSHLCPPRPVFTRTRFTGASPDNQGHFGSNISGDFSLMRQQPLPTPLYNSFHGANQQHISGCMADSVFVRPELSVLESFDVRYSSHVQPPTQNHSLPLTGYLVRDPVPRPPHMGSQPHTSCNPVNTVPFRTLLPSQPSLGCFDNRVLSRCNSINQPYGPAPSQIIGPVLLDSGSVYASEQSSRSMTPTNPNVGKNQSYQPYNTNFSLVPGQNVLLSDSQTRNSLDTQQDDFGLYGDASLSLGNLQVSSGNSQIQSVGAMDNSQGQKETEYDHHQSDSVHNASLLTNPDSLDFQFDNWMFENQPGVDTFEVPMSPFWNGVLEPASLDAGNIYDSLSF